MDSLAGNGTVRYETAGSFKNGKVVYIQVGLEYEYEFNGDRVKSYLVLCNTFDGSGAIKVVITPIRVICQNTLNLALKTAKQKWSIIHKQSVGKRVEEARAALGLAENYMKELKKETEKLAMIKVSPFQLERVIIPALIPIDDGASNAVIDKRMEQRAELLFRYKEAPDLSEMGHNGYRVINAVADYIDHRDRKNTKDKQENFLFKRLNETSNELDKAREMILAIA